MKVSFIGKIILFGIATFNATTSSAFSSASKVDGSKTEIAQSIKKRMNEMDQIYGVSVEYDYNEDERYVEGTDNDDDGVRDALMDISKSLVFAYPNVTKNQFDELYQLTIDMQPSEGPDWQRVKSEKEFQCRFAKIKLKTGIDASYKELRNSILGGANKRAAYWNTIRLVKSDPFICDVDFEFAP